MSDVIVHSQEELLHFAQGLSNLSERLVASFDSAYIRRYAAALEAAKNIRI